MLLKTRKYPKYLNESVISEISKKWFSVYNYIDLNELILTARKDFLEILSKINIPFAIITIILGVISFYIWNFLFLFLFLFIAYFVIFTIIFFKLLWRTKLFLYISEVVYTKTWIMISDDFLYYKKDQERLLNKLDKYELVFDEYLWKPSNLNEVISKKKKEILDWSLENAGKLTKSMWNIARNREWWQLAIAVLFSTFLYIASLYAFYYIGYFFSFLFSKIYLFILSIVISFKDKIELKIKNKTLVIDKKLSKMNLIYKVLKNKIDNFKDW